MWILRVFDNKTNGEYVLLVFGGHWALEKLVEWKAPTLCRFASLDENTLHCAQGSSGEHTYISLKRHLAECLAVHSEIVRVQRQHQYELVAKSSPSVALFESVDDWTVSSVVSGGSDSILLRACGISERIHISAARSADKIAQV